MSYFNPSLGNVIAGVAFLISVGFNGLLIHLIKEHQGHEDELFDALNTQSDYVKELEDANKSLAGNQKPIPWNKGKSGYKLTRKPKVYALDTDANGGVVAAWDANGVMTVSPKWDAVVS